MSIQTRQTPKTKHDVVNKGYVDEQITNTQLDLSKEINELQESVGDMSEILDLANGVVI